MYKKQWNILEKKFKNGKLAHAYLFSGRHIGSINDFSKKFAKKINCLAGVDEKKSCQKCQNCIMIEREVFPDLIFLRSDQDKSKNSGILQIRNIQNFLSYKSYYGNFKIVIIENAEKMNTESQNCLLKSLEEPRGQTIIFLTCLKPDMLLPTITSRCQQIKFFHEDTDDILVEEEKILTPLKKIIILDLAERFNYAKNYDMSDEGFQKILSVLRKYFRNMLISKIIGNSNERIENNYSVLQIRKIIDLIEKLSYQSELYNINYKLALEVLLMEI